MLLNQPQRKLGQSCANSQQRIDGHINNLQSVKGCVRLRSNALYLRKAGQGCACLMPLVHHTSMFYVRVNSIILKKLRYYSIHPKT